MLTVIDLELGFPHVVQAAKILRHRTDLSGRSVTEETSSSRPPTAFQTFLGQQDIPWPKSWRTLGS